MMRSTSPDVLANGNYGLPVFQAGGQPAAGGPAGEGVRPLLPIRVEDARPGFLFRPPRQGSPPPTQPGLGDPLPWGDPQRSGALRAFPKNVSALSAETRT